MTICKPDRFTREVRFTSPPTTTPTHSTPSSAPDVDGMSNCAASAPAVVKSSGALAPVQDTHRPRDPYRHIAWGLDDANNRTSPPSPQLQDKEGSTQREGDALDEIDARNNATISRQSSPSLTCADSCRCRRALSAHEMLSLGDGMIRDTEDTKRARHTNTGETSRGSAPSTRINTHRLQTKDFNYSRVSTKLRRHEQIDRLDQRLREEQATSRRLRSAISALTGKLERAEEGRQRSNALERAFFSCLAGTEALVSQKSRLVRPGVNETRAECLEASRREAHKQLAFRLRRELEANSPWGMNTGAINDHPLRLSSGCDKNSKAHSPAVAPEIKGGVGGNQPKTENQYRLSQHQRRYEVDDDCGEGALVGMAKQGKTGSRMASDGPPQRDDRHARQRTDEQSGLWSTTVAPVSGNENVMSSDDRDVRVESAPAKVDGNATNEIKDKGITTIPLTRASLPATITTGHHSPGNPAHESIHCWDAEPLVQAYRSVAGDTIRRLSSSLFGDEILAVEAARTAAEEREKMLEERARVLFESQVSVRVEKDQLESFKASMRAQVSQARAALREAKGESEQRRKLVSAAEGVRGNLSRRILSMQVAKDELSETVGERLQVIQAAVRRRVGFLPRAVERAVNDLVGLCSGAGGPLDEDSDLGSPMFADGTGQGIHSPIIVGKEGLLIENDRDYKRSSSASS